MTHFARIMASTALAIGMTAGAAAAAPVFAVVDWDHQGATNGAGIDFAVGYGAHTPLDSSWTAAPDTQVGNTTNVAQSPFNSNTQTAGSTYFSVDPVNTVNNPAILTFDTLQTVFSILWGSVDVGNSITFWNGMDSWTVTGTQVATAADAALLPNGQGNYEISALVNFSGFDNGFDRVQFGSKNIAMEFALAPIPLPAGGLLLLGALGGLAALRRRKNV